MFSKCLAALIVGWGAGAGPIYAALGDVVSSFRAPGTSVRGLARSETRLYAVVFGKPTRVYQLAPVSGSVYGSWVPSFGNNCRGLAFSDGGRLWVGCYGDDCVYECAASNGSIYRSWSAGHDPFGLATHCTADGGVGATAIFSSAYAPSLCWRHNMNNGSILAVFEICKSSFFDIAWDHRNKLIWMGDLPDRVYGYNTSGSVVASFTVPGTYPYGMAYCGEYLWVGCDGNDCVYRVHCPGNIGVSPASFGEVKALFR